MILCCKCKCTVRMSNKLVHCRLIRIIDVITYIEYSLLFCHSTSLILQIYCYHIFCLALVCWSRLHFQKHISNYHTNTNLNWFSLLNYRQPKLVNLIYAKIRPLQNEAGRHFIVTKYLLDEDRKSDEVKKSYIFYSFSLGSLFSANNLSDLRKGNNW